MPEWMTPELFPVWWVASLASFSRMTSRALGTRSPRAHAVARPTMPPPMIAMSQALSMAHIDRIWHDRCQARNPNDIRRSYRGGKVLRRAPDRTNLPAPARSHRDRSGQRVVLVPHDEPAAAPR